MNRSPLLLLWLLLPMLTQAADDATVVKSEIDRVTVFLKGAQVTRKAKVTLQPGTNELRFEDLSPGINPNSIQVAGNQKFTILSVNHRINFLEEVDLSDDLELLQERRESLWFRMQQQERLIAVHTSEKNMILANKKISSEAQSLNVEDLVELSNYYRSRLREIEYTLLDIRKEKRSLSEQIGKVDRQLNELNSKRQQNKSEVTISVSSKIRTSANVEISYMVYQAGWIPLYDVRSENTNAPIELAYKSKVWQSSGYDWEDVKLKLSTGDPMRSNTQPSVKPWMLAFEDPNAYRSFEYKERDKYFSSTRSDSLLSLEGQLGYMDAPAPAGGAPAFGLVMDPNSTAALTTMVSGSVNVEFDIEVKYDIPTDGKYYDVEIQQYSMPASYAWYAAPKFDNDAFLVARIAGWDQYNLLPGEAHVYHQGTFVGKSYLNPEVVSDSLELSLGRDKSVVVERKKIKDFSKNTTVGSSSKTQLGLEISVRNGKGVPIRLTLVDQVPISSTKEIMVELQEAHGADYNEETGKLIWKLNLAPGATQSQRLIYTVKYPKGKTIGNL